MKRIPRHIGIIPDGNRRWARQNGLKKEEGYAYGLEPGLKLLQAARAYGIQELTYYGFTVDNCKRPKEQVAAFSDACVSAVKLLKQEAAELHVIGNTNLLRKTGSSSAPRRTMALFWDWAMCAAAEAARPISECLPRIKRISSPS